ncbi:MAG: tetratricopeptide repeat protein, partial [Thermodesulfobacteriota bacterium]|nr:tetratricopeptide repeat protein [Thermodesulfobacteriota bacterium]
MSTINDALKKAKREKEFRFVQEYQGYIPNFDERTVSRKRQISFFVLLSLLFLVGSGIWGLRFFKEGHVRSVNNTKKIEEIENASPKSSHLFSASMSHEIDHPAIAQKDSKKEVPETEFFYTTRKNDKKTARVYYNEANEYQAHGEFDKAIEYYKKAILENRNFVEAYNNLGNIYLNHKDFFDEAHALYQKALEINPNHGRSHNNMGTLYAKTGQLDLAISAFKKATEIDDSLVSPYYNLACVYAQQNKEILALEYLKEAIKRDGE